MNQLTYHHYGTAILNAPIARLRHDIHSILDTSQELLRDARHTTAVLEEVAGDADGSRTLRYRSTMRAPEIAEYVATCTLACAAEAPHTILVEWQREYRPAEAATRERLQLFVSALLAQDQAIASRFAAEYGSADVFYMDYTLGGA